MTQIKKNLITILLLFSIQNSFAQVDTNMVNLYFEKARAFEKIKSTDSAIVYYSKACSVVQLIEKDFQSWSKEKTLSILNSLSTQFITNRKYQKAIELSDSVISLSNSNIKIVNQYTAKAFLNKGFAFYYLNSFDIALENLYEYLQQIIFLYGDKNNSVAFCYNFIANIYWFKNDFHNSLTYFIKYLNLKSELLGQESIDIGAIYKSIGIVYFNLGELDKAMEYYLKSLALFIKLTNENSPQVAEIYLLIGNVCWGKNEFDKALEYYFKCLNIRVCLFGETDQIVATCYNNIGSVYNAKTEYDRSLEYHFKSLSIRKQITEKENTEIADSYINIGVAYFYKKEYDKALEYYLKSLRIYTLFLGEKNSDVALSYINIGLAYKEKKEYLIALDYFIKSLEIYRSIYGEKHPTLAMNYFFISELYYLEKKYQFALEFSHKSIIADLKSFVDTNNYYSPPIVIDYFEWNYLLKNLYTRADIIKDSSNNLCNNNQKKLYFLQALQNYSAADTLIQNTRQKITSLSDKLSLGHNSSIVYNGGIDVCQKLAQLSKKKNAEEYNQLAFYFSEKNKSQILLQALSGQEAQRYAGIPDSLLEKEHNLKININFYEQKLAEGLDSIPESNFRDKLFAANRQYEELIANFETSYPEYFNLKYSTKNVEVKDLQKLLDAKTAILSYFVGDSTIYIFTITNKILDIQQIAKIQNLEDTIRYFRYGLTKFSDRMYDIYRRTGYQLYKQVIPDILASNKQIENLIIIPDGAMATIPFEALLTDNPVKMDNDFKNYPFLINRYNVSYSYSANLFYRTFPKEKQKQPELTHINDWLALAPVFDDKSDQGVMLATRELQKQLSSLQSDTMNVRGRLLTGDYITPLPGTESETQAIIKQYENRNLKAQALLHQSANEQFIKAGGLEKYKVLHFATHGFVNSEKPELSGILLAQDSTGNQDGILYSGEIYNLKLNADLVVLSACETGLGKINKGEGIIGLTRALLYAGSKNIIVSLWQVSDESTSNLMIDFYENLLNTNSNSFSTPLREAKLKMISEGKFAHPFYWSPFILIGK